MESEKERLLALIRHHAEAMRGVMNEVSNYIESQVIAAADSHNVEEMVRIENADPHRWLDNARHCYQASAMFAERAVNQPDHF